MENSIPTYTPEDYSNLIQELESRVVLVDDTTINESSSSSSIPLNNDQPYLYSHFLKPWGQILSQQLETDKENSAHFIDSSASD